MRFSGHTVPLPQLTGRNAAALAQLALIHKLPKQTSALTERKELRMLTDIFEEKINLAGFVFGLVAMVVIHFPESSLGTQVKS